MNEKEFFKFCRTNKTLLVQTPEEMNELIAGAVCSDIETVMTAIQIARNGGVGVVRFSEKAGIPDRRPNAFSRRQPPLWRRSPPSSK